MNALAEAVSRSNVLVCVGSGGVGKTTVAAALALRAAVEGKGSLVCTIDPARRLANALGLDELGNAELRIADAVLAKASGQPARAPMHAMMLDMKRAWDELIEQRAPPDKRDKILGNRFYQSLSSALAGSQEYIAMEKLCELRNQRNYPLIVLDTPPTAHALPSGAAKTEWRSSRGCSALSEVKTAPAFDAFHFVPPSPTTLVVPSGAALTPVSPDASSIESTLLQAVPS